MKQNGEKGRSRTIVRRSDKAAVLSTNKATEYLANGTQSISQSQCADLPQLISTRNRVVACYVQKQVSSHQGAGQRQSGNTTPAHYLKLLASASMLVGLHKLAGQKVQQRGSSLKFHMLNDAFVSAQLEVVLEQAKADRSLWGRLVESATGAYLFNGCVTDGLEPFYWREGNKKGGLRSEERALVDRWIV